MSLKELTDENGDLCLVDPSEVVGIRRKDTIRNLCLVERRGKDALSVCGTVREVGQALTSPQSTIPREAVAKALTLEYRMALGWDGMSKDNEYAFRSIRMALRNLAQRVGVVLDEQVINTPLNEGGE